MITMIKIVMWIWFGANRLQAITCINDDEVLWHHVAMLGINDLTFFVIITLSLYTDCWLH